MRKGIAIVLALIGIFCISSSAHAWGDIIEKIEFTSKDVANYPDILNGLDDNADVTIYGNLVIPKKIEGKIPAMIYVHGSGGLNDSAKKRQKPWLKMFRENGIATFQLDCFKGRGVKDTVGAQTKVDSSDMVVDVYRALNTLARHPRIDAARVGLIGESKGGGVVLYSMWKPLVDVLGKNNQFAAHVSLYGTCVDFENFEFSKAPLLVLVGKKDNWTPAAPWTSFMEKMKQHGYNAELVVYEGAYHCFDAPYKPFNYSKGHSYANCRFLMKDEGFMIETGSGISLAEDKESALASCRDTKSGVMIGMNMKAKKASKEKTKDFVTTVFNL
jgi:dienelactone hydrolase